MRFKIASELRNIEMIASGRGVRSRLELIRRFGNGNWRKMKGTAEVMYSDGNVWLAELHWYEAHGIGRKIIKVKKRLRRL
jgi:hypothetical protein